MRQIIISDTAQVRGPGACPPEFLYFKLQISVKWCILKDVARVNFKLCDLRGGGGERATSSNPNAPPPPIDGPGKFLQLIVSKKNKQTETNMPLIAVSHKFT